MKQEKQKKSISSMAFSLVHFLTGVLFTVVMWKMIDSSISKGADDGSRLYILCEICITLVIAIYIQTFAHEAGHYVFGKCSGYEFISFRVGNIIFIKEKNQIKRKKYNVVGTGGQCLMMPPECDGNQYPYILYNLGGVIVNILFGIFCLALYYLLPEIPFLSRLFVMLFLFGIFFAILNGIPMKTSSIANDGYNVIALGKEKEAQNGLWLQLKVNSMTASGIRIKDMKKEWFEQKEDENLDNPLICSVAMMRCGYFHDLKEFDKAKAESEYILNHANDLLGVYKNEIYCDLLFYEIIGECREEKIEELYTNELKRYIKATSSYISRSRLMYAYELLVNDDQEEAKKQLLVFEKVAKTYPYAIVVEAERELIEMIDEMVGITDIKQL